MFIYIKDVCSISIVKSLEMDLYFFSSIYIKSTNIKNICYNIMAI